MKCLVILLCIYFTQADVKILQDTPDLCQINGATVGMLCNDGNITTYREKCAQVGNNLNCTGGEDRACAAAPGVTAPPAPTGTPAPPPEPDMDKMLGMDKVPTGLMPGFLIPINVTIFTWVISFILKRFLADDKMEYEENVNDTCRYAMLLPGFVLFIVSFMMLGTNEGMVPAFLHWFDSFCKILFTLREMPDMMTAGWEKYVDKGQLAPAWVNTRDGPFGDFSLLSHILQGPTSYPASLLAFAAANPGNQTLATVSSFDIPCTVCDRLNPKLEAAAAQILTLTGDLYTWLVWAGDLKSFSTTIQLSDAFYWYMGVCMKGGMILLHDAFNGPVKIAFAGLFDLVRFIFQMILIAGVCFGLCGLCSPTHYGYHEWTGTLYKCSWCCMAWICTLVGFTAFFSGLFGGLCDHVLTIDLAAARGKAGNRRSLLADQWQDAILETLERFESPAAFETDAQGNSRRRLSGWVPPSTEEKKRLIHGAIDACWNNEPLLPWMGNLSDPDPMIQVNSPTPNFLKELVLEGYGSPVPYPPAAQAMNWTIFNALAQDTNHTKDSIDMTPVNGQSSTIQNAYKDHNYAKQQEYESLYTNISVPLTTAFGPFGYPTMYGVFEQALKDADVVITEAMGNATVMAFRCPPSFQTNYVAMHNALCVGPKSTRTYWEGFLSLSWVYWILCIVMHFMSLYMLGHANYQEPVKEFAATANGFAKRKSLIQAQE